MSLILYDNICTVYVSRWGLGLDFGRGAPTGGPIWRGDGTLIEGRLSALRMAGRRSERRPSPLEGSVTADLTHTAVAHAAKESTPLSLLIYRVLSDDGPLPHIIMLFPFLPWQRD